MEMTANPAVELERIEGQGGVEVEMQELTQVLLQFRAFSCPDFSSSAYATLLKINVAALPRSQRMTTPVKALLASM